MSNVVQFPKSTVGKIGTHEDAERYTLELQLQNEMAITLVYWKNGDPPSVGIWTGSGEHDFGQDTLERWRAWVETALGRQSFEDFGRAIGALPDEVAAP